MASTRGLVLALAVLALWPAAGVAQEPGGSLFVLAGQSGELRPVKGERGRFDLVLGGVGHVTSFTDRPERRADTLSLRRLVRRWRSFGFAEDPPNAALVLADAPPDRDAVVLELGRPRVLRGGHALALRATLVPGRGPDALARLVSRADRRVPVRFGRASLFIDPSGQQRVTVAFSVSGLGNSILSMDLTGPWKMSQLEVEFHQAPVTLFTTGLNGFALTGGNTPAPSIGFTLVANGTGNAVTGVAQVPPGVTVRSLAPSDQTITSGQFSIPIP
jgi:hypothetical protein